MHDNLPGVHLDKFNKGLTNCSALLGYPPPFGIYRPYDEREQALRKNGKNPLFPAGRTGSGGRYIPPAKM